MKAPAAVRVIAALVVLSAVVVRFWPHPAVHAPVAPAAASSPATPVAAADEARAATGFRSEAHLAEHFAKHGADFHAATAADYLRLAQALRDRPAGGGVLELRRPDGAVTRFDRASGAFLACDADGTIRTFFRPHDGERYFERQASRPHGAP